MLSYLQTILEQNIMITSLREKLESVEAELAKLEDERYVVFILFLLSF